ncbi:MAG: M1 family peptidase, partial [Myxococcota bacterium]
MAASRATRTPSRRLAPGIRPSRVALDVEIDPQNRPEFRGEVAIELQLERATRRIRLHAVDLRVTRPRVEVDGRTLRGRVEVHPSIEMVEVHLPEAVPAGTARLRLAF